ncbi:hypothetical protein ANRL4_03308 [Anaerolineae bacterium]|nr:hypothetical protein ANRL4_03308 [Anaerolineae bacterium]
MMSLIPDHTLQQIVHRINPHHEFVNAQPLIGGASAQVLLLDVKQTDGERLKYLLRIHSEIDRKRNPDLASNEFKLLKTLRALGLPVPTPFYLDVSGELHAVPYLVTGYIEGAPDFSPQDLPNFIRQSAEMLTQIHRVGQGAQQGDLSALGFLSDRAAHVQWWLHYQPESMDESLNEAQLRDTLRQLFPLESMNQVTLLHGDFWAGNLIWQKGKLVGVIDWEDAEIGDPLSDLSIARLDMLWAFGQATMHDFTKAYQAFLPHLDYGNLPRWDLFTALRPANQLADWAAAWTGYGRPDVTLTTMRESHQWFVKQAMEKL